MKKTADPKWIRWFQRNLAFICKLEEALSPESFKQVCGFVNEYRRKKRQHGYRLQDREEIEKQILPFLVALDQEILSEFMEILENDVPKKSMPSGSNRINAMHVPNVEFNPAKSGHLSTNPNSSDQLQSKSSDEVVQHHNGLIRDGKSVGLEDVPVLNPDDPSQAKRRRIQRPPVAPIMSSGSRHHDIVGDVSLESKKRNDGDKHMRRVRQDEHKVHGEHVRQPVKKYLDDATTKCQLVSEDINCTPIRSSVVNGNSSRTLKSEDHHQLHEHHDDKRMRAHPRFMKLSSEDIQKAPAAAFLVNLSKEGDRTLQETIKNVLQLFCDKKLPSYYANKCICMLLEAHRKLLNEFCELIGFQWFPEVNIRSYDGGRLGLRDRAFKQYTYIEEAAKNDKLCSLEKDVPLSEAEKIGKNICKATISLEIQLHKDMLEEKQFSDNLKAKLRGNRNHRWWPGCTFENVTPNIGSNFQVTPENIPKNLRNPNDHVVTPNVSFKCQASAAEFLAHPHNSVDQIVTPTEDSEIQASAVDFLVHPHVSNDQTTTIDCHKNDLISEERSSMRKLESDLSHFWLERIVKLDNTLSNVKRMLFELQEHPPNWSCKS